VHSITQTKLKLLVYVQSICTKNIHCNKYIKIQKQSPFWQDSNSGIFKNWDSDSGTGLESILRGLFDSAPVWNLPPLLFQPHVQTLGPSQLGSIHKGQPHGGEEGSSQMWTREQMRREVETRDLYHISSALAARFWWRPLEMSWH